MNKLLLTITMCFILSMAANVFLLTRDPLPSTNSGEVKTHVPELKASPNDTLKLRTAQKDKIPSPDQLLEISTQLESDMDGKSVDSADVGPLQEPLDRGASTQLTALNSQYDAESYDVDWAPKIEAQTIEQFYANNILGSDIASVDCRETLCKILVTHQDEHAKLSFHEKLLQQMHGVHGALFHNLTDSGEWETLIYRIR